MIRITGLLPLNHPARVSRCVIAKPRCLRPYVVPASAGASTSLPGSLTGDSRTVHSFYLLGQYPAGEVVVDAGGILSSGANDIRGVEAAAGSVVAGAVGRLA